MCYIAVDNASLRLTSYSLIDHADKFSLQMIVYARTGSTIQSAYSLIGHVDKFSLHMLVYAWTERTKKQYRHQMQKPRFWFKKQALTKWNFIAHWAKHIQHEIRIEQETIYHLHFNLLCYTTEAKGNI